MAIQELPELNRMIGTHDIIFITLDTLRWDVAEDALDRGLTPQIANRLPGGRWEKRHSPGSFTFAAHHAFFAGFLPTPATPGKHPRLFAADFPGSETTTDDTFCFAEADIVSALSARGYHTLCVGGVGFFNKQTALGRVLPDLFQESHWCPEFSVSVRDSTENQVNFAIRRFEAVSQRMFLFLNVSALHQPNCFYLPGEHTDSRATQVAAMQYVDGQLGRLWEALQQRGPGFCILCSDHGTAYGEDGYVGHRIGHSCVWDVPFAQFPY